MLRYVFDDAAQARRHLHLSEGRALLFFGDSAAPGIGGERVMLDMEFPSGQHALLRGTVQSRVPHTGVWLDFPDSGLLRRLGESQAALGARRQRRFGAELMVEVRSLRDGSRQVGKLVDLSAGGAQIAGCRFAPGGEVMLSSPLPIDGVPREFGRGRVLRANERGTAIEFLRGDAQSRQAIAALVDFMHTRWSKATKIDHPRGCCAERGVIEPPLPRTRPRD